MTAKAFAPPRILVVDDEPGMIAGITRVLAAAGIAASGVSSAGAAQEELSEQAFDAVLLDIAMPGVNGIELCRRLRTIDELKRLPVLFLTGQDDLPTIEAALEAGGDDYVLKPFHSRELIARVRAAVERFRAIRDLDDAEAVLLSLARAIEAKDGTTADHCDRLSRMAVQIGRRLGLPDVDLEALRKGGILHDIGKIGIPDAILLKPGRLTDEERDLMRTHAVIGAELVAPLRTMARTWPIVRHHHERWDGSGYPDGLAGAEIPHLARIFQVCDVFDALTSERPYKAAMTPDQALGVLESETRKGWSDPEIVGVFINHVKATELERIRRL